MHPLHLLLLMPVVIFTVYSLWRFIEKCINPTNKIKSKKKAIEEKVKAFDEVKKVNTKTNKKKVKKVNKFLKEKNS